MAAVLVGIPLGCFTVVEVTRTGELTTEDKDFSGFTKV